MLGTLLNCAGIIVGAVAGCLTRREIPTRQQMLLRIIVGVAAVWFGLSIAIKPLTAGGWRYGGKLFAILLLSMIAGRLVGRLLHLQAGLNRAGQFAKEKLTSTNPNDGLTAAVILFCAAPLGIVGAIEDGLANEFRPLLVKAIIDALGAFSFARVFGWRVGLSALPLGGLLVSIAYAAGTAAPWLQQHDLLDPIHVVCGFLVLYVSMIVFEIKKVELGDYLPAVAVAAGIGYVMR